MSRNPDTKASHLYEYTIHESAENTLQVFTTHTMSSTYFSAMQTLDLLQFLEEHRADIERLAQEQQAMQERRRTSPKTMQERIDDLFS